MAGKGTSDYKGKLKSGYGTGGTRKGAAGSANSAEDFGRAGAGMAKGFGKVNRAGSGSRGVRKEPKGGVPGGGLGSYRK